MSDVNHVHYVITLVHGTRWFGLKPHWTKPHSRFYMALQAHFGSRATINTFCWSGRNANGARRHASETLRDELARQIDADPTSRHMIICHSHGGNVAMRALKDSTLAGNMAGIVCLATPFLVARKRDLGSHWLEFILATFVIVPFIVIGFTNRVLLKDLHALWRIPLSLVFAAIAVYLCGVLMRFWDKYAELLLSDFEWPQINHEKVLIVRSPGDEASAALALFQCVSQLSVMLFTQSVSVYNWFEIGANTLSKNKLFAILLLILSIYILHLTFTAVLLPDVQPGIRALAILLAELFFGGALCLLFGNSTIPAFMFRMLTGLTIWPVIVLLSLVLIPFGWEVAIANILLDVTAEVTPPGVWQVHLVEQPASSALGKKHIEMMHSILFDNPRIHSHIFTWIEAEVHG